MNQYGRRNLQAVDRVKLAMKLEDVIKEMARKRQEGGQGGKLLQQNSDKANEPINTNQKLAGVSGGQY